MGAMLSVAAAQERPAQAPAVTEQSLSVWARQFATLVGVGVNLARCLEVLQAVSDRPLSDISGQMRADLLAGLTLSESMHNAPQAFDGFALSMCRAGEVGGVPGQTLAAWADWLAEDVSSRLRTDSLLLAARGVPGAKPGGGPEAQLREAFSKMEDQRREIAFCRTLGMMLKNGVPVLQALEVASGAYPDGGQRAKALRDAVKAGGSLAEAMGGQGFSPVTCALAAAGEEDGHLEVTLGQAAEVLRQEVEARTSAAVAALVAGDQPQPKGN
jgi:type II secretory pathway component PulF